MFVFISTWGPRARESCMYSQAYKLMAPVNILGKANMYSFINLDYTGLQKNLKRISVRI
jgi:hypothetical protein